ncbi:MAG: hypothetical protein OEY56_11845 [Cyclobacteriaceae bacterium]|nr:hypothetical protein [Cyclobacteriaceae bacterium]
MKKKVNRRVFFQKALGVPGVLAATPTLGSTETRKMLTSDGILVEVPLAAMKDAPTTKASGQDVLEWSTKIIK